MIIRHSLLVFIALLLIACSKTEEVPFAEPVSEPAASQIEPAVEIPPSELAFRKNK